LIEAASSGPFFHNNAIETIEGAVAFYDGESFNQSPAGRFLASTDEEGAGIELYGTQIVAISAFLRVINVLENVRQATELLEGSILPPSPRREPPKRLVLLARFRTDDAISVLEGGGLHPVAVQRFREARAIINEAVESKFRAHRIQEAIRLPAKAGPISYSNRA
jgi:hypothetical protein